MAAFASVLEAVGGQKQVLQDRLATATGPLKALLIQQLACLTAQETAILTRAGVPNETAQQALASADANETLYKRDGKRFVAVTQNGHTNGVDLLGVPLTDENGHPKLFAPK